jgi:general stress protein YciG
MDMAGNKIGGAKCAAVNKAKHGEDFYKRIGALGGSKSTTGGFFANRELARRAGSIGGKISKRGKKVTV